MAAKTHIRQRVRVESIAFKFRDTIAQLNHSGHNDASIAEQLSLSVAEVTRQRKALNLPSTESAGSTWSKTEDEKILDLRDRRGFLWVKIASTLTGRTASQVQTRYKYLSRLQLKGARTVIAKKLPCLKCRKDFVSPDPVRIRRCDACKAEDAGIPEYYADNGGTEGVAVWDDPWMSGTTVDDPR